MNQDFIQLISQQRNYFDTGVTKSIDFRISALKKLREQVMMKENDIYEALYQDFKKSTFETALSETGLVLMELDLAIKKLKHWAKPQRVFPSFLNFPSNDKIYAEPYGATLIIAPWNYPFQLAFSAVVGSIAAGNTVVLKPSELTPHTSKLIADIVASAFQEQYIAAVEGGVETAQSLLAQRWDYIFFTGSVPVGKIVARAAAKHLTPVTLELGGKSPCIIHHTANIKLAAKRITWGKFFNGGQTCIAPDYLLVQKAVKQDLAAAIKNEIETAYGTDPKKSEDFPRIINERNFKRLAAMLRDQEFLIGGEQDINELYIAPTLIDEPDLESKVMEDEIFGPVLPVISYESETELENIIKRYEKPLSFYVFSTDRSFTDKLIQTFSFGGGVVNDTMVHFGNHRLPFGGVGHSGIGAYHGKASFDTFTHRKSVVKRGNWLDVPIRYAPYQGKLNKLKFFLKYFK